MTQVTFYFNAPSKAGVAVRLAAKAHQAGQGALLYTEDERLAVELDQSLWTAQKLTFIPHVRCGHPLAAKTPVLIGTRAEELASPDVLINLTDAEPPSCERFGRLIEIVTGDGEDRRRARGRYKQYQEQGHALETHDLGS